MNQQIKTSLGVVIIIIIIITVWMFIAIYEKGQLGVSRQIVVQSKKQETKNKTKIANPASVNCEQKGGTLNIRTSSDGGQIGMCKFSDGSECEEWSYFRGECNLGNDSNNTSNWQIYRNDEYGFEIKYPNSWEMLENDPNSNALNFSLRDKKYERSFEWPGLYIKDNDFSGDFTNSKQSSKLFEINKAINDVVSIVFTENGKQFYANCSLYIDSSVITMCNSIISTFKFTK